MQQLYVSWAITAAFGVLAGYSLASERHFRKKAERLEAEANRSADEAARLEGVVAQNLRDLDDKDFQIGRFIAERDIARRYADGMARQMAPAIEAVINWNANNPNRKIKGLSGLAAKAFISGPNGRLVRLVPKVPTDG